MPRLGALSVASGAGAHSQGGAGTGAVAGVWTPLAFPTELLDEDNYWASGDNTRLTVASAGVYLVSVSAQVTVDAVTHGHVGLRIRRYNTGGVAQAILAETEMYYVHDEVAFLNLALDGADVFPANHYVVTEAISLDALTWAAGTVGNFSVVRLDRA